MKLNPENQQGKNHQKNQRRIRKSEYDGSNSIFLKNEKKLITLRYCASKIRRDYAQELLEDCLQESYQNKIIFND